MSEATSPAAAASAPASPASPASPTTPAVETPAEWKPEPRQWTWKDLFTAPMLAFKPKCMLVSALTVLALAAVGFAQGEFTDAMRPAPGWQPWIAYAFGLISLIVFSLGAVLVSVFLRADLLDDEFLSLKEAFAQYRSRIAPAILVPVFLVALLIGVRVVLWLGMVVCSIPWAGGFLYALGYLFAFAGALFFLLLAIALTLSLFVFPGIIAVRRHGWFDNVVDTIEAVGTKPHVLVGSLVLTFAMIFVALGLTSQARGLLAEGVHGRFVPGTELAIVEQRAGGLVDQATAAIARPLSTSIGALGLPLAPSPAAAFTSPLQAPTAAPHRDAQVVHTWGSGLLTGIVQILILALATGYALNLFLSGGILTYLIVREDDYWDDEDMEDLDALAKELEEEAKKEEASGVIAIAGAAAAPTGAAPQAPASPTPPAPAPPA